MIEYWLQKKTIGGWSNVTWYSEAEAAKINYDTLRKGVGYSYRMCKVEVVEQHLLEEIVEVPSYKEEVKKIWTTPESEAKANVWGGQKIKPGVQVQELEPKSSWTTPSLGWGEKPASGWNSFNEGNSVKPEHGLSGSVWVIHHANKDKKRVPASEVDDMLAKGYEIGGPRTQFRS